MSGTAAGPATQAAVSRWLRFTMGPRQSAVRLETLVRVLEKKDWFVIPSCPAEFKGVIYFSDRAVPILNWAAFGPDPGEGRLLMVLEQGRDWLGIEVAETGGVKDFAPGSKVDGFWIELDPERGVWGLDENLLYQTLRRDR